MVALEALDLGEDPTLLFGQLYVVGHSSSSRAARLLWGESSPPPARLERGKRPDQCVDDLRTHAHVRDGSDVVGGWIVTFDPVRSNDLFVRSKRSFDAPED
jgi:hypothetical protein